MVGVSEANEETGQAYVRDVSGREIQGKGENHLLGWYSWSAVKRLLTAVLQHERFVVKNSMF